jgi:hypothetical protein
MSDFKETPKYPTAEEIMKLIRRFGDPHEQDHSMAERFAIADALEAANKRNAELEPDKAILLCAMNSIANNRCGDNYQEARRVAIEAIEALAAQGEVMSDLVRANLCVYDPRSDVYLEDSGDRSDDCSCDNCFYGRDRLALRIAELEAAQCRQ